MTSSETAVVGGSGAAGAWSAAGSAAPSAGGSAGGGEKKNGEIRMEERDEEKKALSECEDKRTTTRSVPWICTFRWTLAIVGFFGMVNMYALRVNMSVAIVCMVNHTALQLETLSSAPVDLNTTAQIASMSDDSCGAGDFNSTNSTSRASAKDGEFVWDKKTQGLVLSSFFWGYLVTQIPGGWLAQRFGGKRVIGYSLLLSAVTTLLAPVGALGSPYLLVVLRILNGVGQGVVFPAMHVLWSKWAPPLERSKLIGFTYAGAQIGNVLALPISALLCDYGFAKGWGSIFYVLGICCTVWCVVWLLLAHDTPSQHPRITTEEKEYIEKSLGSSAPTNRNSRMPWLSFAKSMPVWAIIVAHTSGNWGTYTLLTNLPAYMKEVLKFDMKSNGLFSAIPFLFFWLFINVGGVIADKMRTKGVHTAVVRKIMLCIGTLVPGALLIATGFVTCHNPYIAVAVLSMAVGFSGFQYPGVMVNHVDIAPPFAGVLFGISNTVATLSGVFAPYVVGLLTKTATQAEWRNVFYLAAVIYLFGAIFFSVFAAGETQPWVKPYLYSAAQEKTEAGEGGEGENGCLPPPHVNGGGKRKKEEGVEPNGVPLLSKNENKLVEGSEGNDDHSEQKL